MILLCVAVAHRRVQNHAARSITGNFYYIICRGIDLVKSLNLYTVCDRRGCFLTSLMFKAIHGIAPTYLSDRIVMNLMLMVMTLEDQIWSYISQPCVKTCIVIVLCIWVANCGMICLSLCSILRVLNYLKIITKCTSWSLAHDCLLFLLAIGLYLYYELLFFLSLNILFFTWMWSFCIFNRHGLYYHEFYICGTTFTWLVLKVTRNCN